MKRRRWWRAMRGGKAVLCDNQPTMVRRDNQQTTATRQSTDDGAIRSRHEEVEGVEGDERGEAARHDNQPTTAQRGTRELTVPKGEGGRIIVTFVDSDGVE